MTEQEIRDLLLINFEYSHQHDDWVYPLADALDGITAEQAAWKPGPGLMGIWDIVLHVAAWNENIIERIETGQKARPSEGAWPPKPDSLTEANWEAAKTRLWASIAALRKLIETVPFEKVHSSPYGFGDLVCRFSHMAYHGGQIVKIRECQGW
jgi:hypothetical protein